MTLDEKLIKLSKEVLTEAVNEEFLKDFSFNIYGILRTTEDGDIVALTYPGREMIGMYIKAEDKTIKLPGRNSIGRGNQLMKIICK